MNAACGPRGSSRGRLLALALLVTCPCGRALAAGAAPPSAAGTPSRITVSFKHDPRLSGATYGGEHWVSPETYTAARRQESVEARAHEADVNGAVARTILSWVPADPEMISVTPRQGNRVTIVVRRAGESKLTVTSPTSSTALLVKASGVRPDLEVQIIQLRSPSTATTPLRPGDTLRAGADVADQPTPTGGGAKRNLPERNKQEGQAFLAANRAKEGVTTLPSGLQYKVLARGQGRTPAEGDTVECRYRGTLLDGTEFGSSNAAGRPAVLKLTNVIPGLREALKRMPVGSRWELYVPPELGYGVRGLRGKRGSGRKVGPFATLVLEVELLAIVESAAVVGPLTTRTLDLGPEQ